MKIHEYQAKEIFSKFGVAVPRGMVVGSVLEARQAAQKLGSDVVVVKSQVHAGGRGKGVFLDSDGGRGVRVAQSIEQVEQFAAAMLGHTLKTAQTGPEGVKVNKVYLEEGQDIARELYLGLTLDRECGRVTFIASAQGGVEIEEVALAHPDQIIREAIDPAIGFRGYQGRKMADRLGLTGACANSFARFCAGLYRVYEANDASLCEINPLVVLKNGEVVALDAKLNFDDNALFRRPTLLELRDMAEEDPREVQAKQFDLNYIALSGNIACMVNGAGLAMATMDTIKLVGGEPANFLDVGGGASKEKVTEAFKLLLADRHVQAVLVNVFGGIMRCDILAEGIVEAAKVVSLKVPLVVRMEGTNVEQGKAILQQSGLKIIAADDLLDAARKAVAAAQNLNHEYTD